MRFTSVDDTVVTEHIICNKLIWEGIKLKIAHVTTFGPNGCGLYEASYNMMTADYLNGHEVYCVDTGIKPDNTTINPQVGAEENRGRFKFKVSHHDILDKMDLIVMHTYCRESWYCRNSAPLVWIIHGRPAAAFRQELNHPEYLAFTAYGNISYWPRVKATVHFWPEYKPYYDAVVMPGKQKVLEFPAIDEERFSPVGKKFDLTFDGKKPEYIGKWNGLICDARRDDIDRFDVLIGALHAAKMIPGLKWHFFGLDTPIKEAEQNILGRIEQIGALGVRIGRVCNMQDIYRSCDFLYTPHKIITQTIGEAVSCCLPVIAQKGNKVAAQTIDVSNPDDLVNVLRYVNWNNFINKPLPTLCEFGAAMNRIYEEAVR